MLKKICGDIYNQNLNDSDLPSLRKKVITKFDIQHFFDRDIAKYVTNFGSEYQECLKYIAKSQPVSKIDVCTKFNSHIIDHLLVKKLVIETGSNYKIYWDIFREYFLDKKLPTIVISYRFRTRISTALKVFRSLRKNITTSALAEKLHYQVPTIDNAIDDLKNFFQVERNEKTNEIIASENIINLQDSELAENLAEQIEHHIVIREIYEQLKPDQWIWLEDFKKIVETVYSTYSTGKKLKPESSEDYSSKMLSWFCFAGLLEIRQDWLIARPSNSRQGKQKGKPSDCELNKGKISKLIVCPGQLSLFD